MIETVEKVKMFSVECSACEQSTGKFTTSRGVSKHMLSKGNRWRVDNVGKGPVYRCNLCLGHVAFLLFAGNLGCSGNTNEVIDFCGNMKENKLTLLWKFFRDGWDARGKHDG